jgi:hypothetical protein
VHPAQLRTQVLELAAAGLRDREIAEATDLPRTTVRDMRRAVRSTRSACPRCWRPARAMRFTPEDYAELLGLYLGDGCISQLARTQHLRLSLDARYPRIIVDARALLGRCFPANRVGTVTADGGHTVVLLLYSSHLSCLFPQHGPDKKHERRLRLEPWQADLVHAAPWSLLRGCIRSDGCVFVNRTGRYAYVSYEFRNRSRDLLELFAETCAAVGAQCRMYDSRVRIYRRGSVALFAEHVGDKR